MDNGVILVFGAHPDDVEIGMGGTIKRFVQEGKKVIVIVAHIPNLKSIRIKETRNAVKILGTKDFVFLPLSTKDFGYNRKTIKEIDSLVKKYKPRSVFTHWIGDSHQDHNNLTKAVIASVRHRPMNVYMYEQTLPGGITADPFSPQLFIDISDYIDDKIASILAHKSQVIKYKHLIDGIRGRAMFRGLQISTKYAEAFKVIKIKDDTGFK